MVWQNTNQLQGIIEARGGKRIGEKKIFMQCLVAILDFYKYANYHKMLWEAGKSMQ
jgi:hypothetical protein